MATQSLVTIDRKELRTILLPIYKTQFRCIPLDEEIDFIGDELSKTLQERVHSELVDAKLKRMHNAFLKPPPSGNASQSEGAGAGTAEHEPKAKGKR